MRRTLYYGSGETAVILDQDKADLLSQAIDNALPGAMDAVSEELEIVYRSAEDHAPVDTGKFKASIRRQLIVSKDYEILRGRLWSDLAYARFIVSPATLPGSGSAFVELFRKPVEAAGERLIRRLGPIIAEKMRG